MILKRLGTLAALPLLLPLAACGGPSVNDAAEDCLNDEDSFVAGYGDSGFAPDVPFQLEDDAIIIDTQFEDSGVQTQFECLLLVLETSSALKSRMESTTAMDGRQSETSNGINYSWTYHPDNGLNMTIEEAE